MMRVAYISGPYRSDTINGIHDNIEAARKVAIKYWLLGYAVICPHMNTAFMDGVLPDEAWLEGDLALLEHCDVIVMLPTYERSRGAKAELQRAIELEKEIIFER